MFEPMAPARLNEIELSIPEAYTAPWTVHPGDDGEWLVGYATTNPLAGLVATVPDYGMYLAEFIATARTAIPELLAEVTRLRTELADTAMMRDFSQRSAEHIAAKRDLAETAIASWEACEISAAAALLIVKKSLAIGPVTAPAAGETSR